FVGTYEAQDFGRLGIRPKQSPSNVFANPPKAGEALRFVGTYEAQDFGRLGIRPKQSPSNVFANPPKAGEAISINTIIYKIASVASLPRNDVKTLFRRTLCSQGSFYET
ncbi:MAG: hypothetical protein WCV56_05560, partial [Candidatus Omnitrophota bacterium]